METGREVGAQGTSSASVHCTSTSTLAAYSAAPSVSTVEPQLCMRCSTTARVASRSMPLRSCKHARRTHQWGFRHRHVETPYEVFLFATTFVSRVRIQIHTGDDGHIESQEEGG